MNKLGDLANGKAVLELAQANADFLTRSVIGQQS